MSNEEIISLLHEALEFADLEISKEINTIELDAKFSQLGIDSVKALEMAAYIEEKLNIRFPDNELGLLTGVQGFVDLIQKYAITPATFEKPS